jgi:hypothetical protein
VKLIPSLTAPPTVTAKGPDVAETGTEVAMDVLLHEMTVAVAPLNVTVLPPWVVPNPVPVIVTAFPVFPEVGLTAVTLKPEEIVKLRPLLGAPTVTTILPVVAPVGTDTTIPVSLQTEGTAVVPLNLTVLEP